MGVYKALKADAASVVLRHEGDDDHVIEIRSGASGASASGNHAPVPQFIQDQVVEGGRYFVSVSMSKAYEAPAPAPVEEPAAAEPIVEPEAQVPTVTEVGQVDQKSGAEVLPAWAVTPDAARTAPVEADETTADS